MRFGEEEFTQDHVSTMTNPYYVLVIASTVIERNWRITPHYFLCGTSSRGPMGISSRYKQV